MRNLLIAGVGARDATGQDPRARVSLLAQPEHLVTDDVVAAHHHAGRYSALCGVVLLAASMAKPGHGRCAERAR